MSQAKAAPARHNRIGHLTIKLAARMKAELPGDARIFHLHPTVSRESGHQLTIWYLTAAEDLPLQTRRLHSMPLQGHVTTQVIEADGVTPLHVYHFGDPSNSIPQGIFLEELP